MLALVLALLSLTSIAAVLFKFITADGDFTLLSKKHAKREEVEDKVLCGLLGPAAASHGDDVVADNSGKFVLLIAKSFICLSAPIASYVVGEVLAKQFASLGAKLIISARNEAELERVKKLLTGKHAPDEVIILPLDLASGEDSLNDAVQKAESCFSNAGVDYMIHNAAYERPVNRGQSRQTTLTLVLKDIASRSNWVELNMMKLAWHMKTTALDVTEESLKKTNCFTTLFCMQATFNINVMGTLSLTRLLAASMLRRGRGHFVVMSSAAGKTPAPGQAVYSASKFALNGYFHSLRSELYRKGIKVTIVCPGPIKTSSVPEANTSGQKGSSEKRVSSERCAELTIIAATHGLKEAWISFQPVLAVMYLVQYMPSIGYWLMDKIGEKRIEVAAQKGDTYSLSLLLGRKKAL
ncbi:hypothetical protein RHGRI_014755 [Rhododendron griersonianum]|uniref:Dehydrogenase/reductase SDR family member 7 n=1 Tax=Rhododendron griersonianum TaxID=479676 RepID=A0AAV6KAM1_9ERIC|nr:hypothetical protein RHGRI_014755 [Rhododendron griersonianum]